MPESCFVSSDEEISEPASVLSVLSGTAVSSCFALSEDDVPEFAFDDVLLFLEPHPANIHTTSAIIAIILKYLFMFPLSHTHNHGNATQPCCHSRLQCLYQLYNHLFSLNRHIFRCKTYSEISAAETLLLNEQLPFDETFALTTLATPRAITRIVRPTITLRNIVFSIKYVPPISFFPLYVCLCKHG